MDPIESIAAIAHRRGVPMHVDACLGGFLIAFMEDLGYDLQGGWSDRFRAGNSAVCRAG